MNLWQQMTDEERFDTLINMKDFGGGFAGHLAEAWLHADSYNTARLAAAFPDLIEKFQPKNWSHLCAAVPHS